MEKEYTIRLIQDDRYGVYDKDLGCERFEGTLDEVHAWIALKEKGFDL